jgi:hypothetical protein
MSEFALATTAIAAAIRHILVMTTHGRQGSEAELDYRGRCNRHRWCASGRSPKSVGALRARRDEPFDPDYGSRACTKPNRHGDLAWADRYGIVKIDYVTPSWSTAP